MVDGLDGLRWQVHEKRRVYESDWVNVDLVKVEPPKTEPFEHHVIKLHHVAVALLINENEEVLTLWRYRFAVDQWGYELIGGLVEEGEDPAETAAREAVEETGWRPVGEPEHLGTFQPLPGIVDAPVNAYIWRHADKVGEPTDGEEAARIEWIPVDRILELVMRGEVLGSGAIVPVLFYLASRGAGSR
ncbi:NUDIX hydrolase [Saccharothrix violaceirubra]|uniref:8-oxo-dGTP pyrophosphatase MutT (NUDIX family) n=1 Tax=Saccharothrix violaceirubra TaxID=413306 RepID=A0A7W7T7H8_9PSEU|nr:NUDIX hydrolase [Saccharothrix violaceirubra]MBB4968008.1 8-oxo-dGTP pyrophosphatase MutT (NUDIX family) [Saccharothrix violaceirubra]